MNIRGTRVIIGSYYSPLISFVTVSKLLYELAAIDITEYRRLYLSGFLFSNA